MDCSREGRSSKTVLIRHSARAHAHKKETEDKKQEATVAFRTWRTIREHLRFHYKLEGTHTMPKFKKIGYNLGKKKELEGKPGEGRRFLIRDFFFSVSALSLTI